MSDLQLYQQARLSRDPRFDGLFFIGVKSTGIYCRPICPAKLPAEHQVEYYSCAAAAALAGFRPCLRCRPDSAPRSPAWLGVQTTLRRAIKLIDQGALQQGNQGQLADRLGISERYLRKLFQQHLGVAPKHYALYQQVLLAKQLLHQTQLPVAEIALRSGFHSLRRFNDAFKQQVQLTPGQIRRRPQHGEQTVLELQLSYRPPLDWEAQLAFWQSRTLDGMEWVRGQIYGRTFVHQDVPGWFELCPHPASTQQNHSLQLKLHWPSTADLSPVLAKIRQLADLDANMLAIEQQLSPVFGEQLSAGLRIPGLWGSFEAAVRAILGQQVSVQGARTQLNRLLAGLAATVPGTDKKLFPTPEAIAGSELLMIKVPQARRETLKALARFVIAQPDSTPDDWLQLKGIGPWTVAYAKMRGLGEPDLWLGGDLGVQKALAHLPAFTEQQLSPWRSYATFQAWHSLSLPKPAKDSVSKD